MMGFGVNLLKSGILWNRKDLMDASVGGLISTVYSKNDLGSIL
jgi:hypothetical protein